jgi:CRP-like cAMP-binding protein/DNA-binding NarL/FixJ family response regulator
MNKTILIIEDNIDMRTNVAEILTLANYKVITAENGKIGIEVARNTKPDLILCDVMMPELDGYGVIRALENIPEMIGIPFIFITAKTEKSDFRTGMDLGADDYITKPFSGNDLLHIISSRLKKNLSIKEKFSSAALDFENFMNDSKAFYNISNLSESNSIKRVKDKGQIYNEGDLSKYLYFIVSGKIKIIRTNEFGKQYITELYKEGDYFGYLAFFGDGIHRDSAIAIEETEIKRVPKEDFFKLLLSNNDVSINFIKLLTNNYSGAEEKLLKLAYNSARKRVAEALLYVSAKYQDSNSESDTSFILLRENISSLSGISPESVSRNLTDFKEEGLIESHKGKIKILNVKKLESIKN